MADEPKTADDETLDFIGMGDFPALHADAYFILQNGDNFTVGFFQHRYPDFLRRARGQKLQIKSNETKCIARISLSPLGFTNFANAIAAHIGCRLEPIKTEEPVK
jgi:hypothetical protein